MFSTKCEQHETKGGSEKTKFKISQKQEFPIKVLFFISSIKIIFHLANLVIIDIVDTCFRYR